MADGGGSGWEQQRLHYNSHVKQGVSTAEALQQRKDGPAQALKLFHNHIKRQLLCRFAHKQERLLDLCCGRGGDLHKWKEAQVKYVKGLDISEREVEEARRRYMETESRQRRGPGGPLMAEFEAVDWLGSRPLEDQAGPGSYGVCTCMFALHYFFISEDSLRMFLTNVSNNLRQGGLFLGTIPSGQRVMELLGGRPELRTPMLRLVRKWKDAANPEPFGSGYICDIADTVTASLEGATEGSLEFLVDLPTLERVAAECGLHPARDWMDPVLMANFVQEDIDAPFKRFLPFFRDSLTLDSAPGKPALPPSSLEQASSLFVAFVFQKTSGPDAITLPIAPECQFMAPPRAPRGPGWGPDDGGMGGPPGPGGGGYHGGGPPPYGHGPPPGPHGPMGGGGHYGHGPPQGHFGPMGGPPPGHFGPMGGPPGHFGPMDGGHGGPPQHKRQRQGGPGAYG
ncbi:hypothetical protein HYH03_007091 [Edaphochlamys debaryana]|uniref:mRNA (guanine-N(7))-methyltransferase n=1 Tax=Edaphochlamys debaryana TaxID=47281 RepID=A0A835Y2P8_9CHLO|nr:hypothetical protein HYH03_007091 [Edaphochlamys debaryana]|eukprot:KAG2494851.1 hypothetical protein HYH03_007091 [Edaphochlamys debaryana]